MIVRALSSIGDWSFGKGRNDYKSARDAYAQNIQTRLKSFGGDCFFAISDGIDWFTFMGSRQQTQLTLAIAATLLNTAGTTGILQLSATLSKDRVFSISYSVQSIYGQVTATFQYDINGIG